MKKSDAKDAWTKVYELANQIQHFARSFEMRQRLNPHHSLTDQFYEKKKFYELQQEAWAELKTTYLAHREEISKMIQEDDNKSGKYREMWITLEKVFDKEATDALEEMISG